MSMELLEDDETAHAVAIQLVLLRALSSLPILA